MQSLIDRNFTSVWSEVAGMEGQKRYTNAIRVGEAQASPFVFLKASTYSSRVYIQGNGWGRLPKKLRKLALKGCVELDLQAAQFGIVVFLWGIRGAKQYTIVGLDGGIKLWGELLNWIGCKDDVDGEAKARIKAVVYTIVFGGHQGVILDTYTESASTDKERDALQTKCLHLLDHPLLQKLVASRDRELKRLEKLVDFDQMPVDAFGKSLDYNARYAAALTEATCHNDTQKQRKSKNQPCEKILTQYHLRFKARGKAVRSLMAQIVQSHEALIMLELVRHLKQEANIVPVLFLHDSMIVKIKSGTCGIDVLKRIAKNVTAFCKNRGYATKLRLEFL